MSLLQLRYALRPGATCVTPGKQVILVAGARKERLAGVQAAQIRDLRPGDPAVERLAAAGWLSITVSNDGNDLYTLRPFGTPPPQPGARGALSKFAVMRRNGSRFVLEHPTSWCDIEIHDAAVAGQVSGLGTLLPDEVSARLAQDLAWGGFTGDTDDFRTASWSAHELWFHRHSNLSERVLNWESFGPTRWAEGTYPPVPARKPVYLGAAVPLAAPDLAQLRAADPPLTAVVEDRVSVRNYDEARPLRADQLGELLFRTARTRELRTADGVEYLSRPHPAGGAVYELELYPIVRNVDGVGAGMYHYDSFEHVLRPVADYGPEVERLLKTSSLTLNGGQKPQVLIVIAARTGRLMWTYEQVPYGIILRHVGIMQQSIYLAATAMGVGAVAQGYGDTAAFTAAAGVDELEECLVGSIVVGNPAR